MKDSHAKRTPKGQRPKHHSTPKKSSDRNRKPHPPKKGGGIQKKKASKPFPMREPAPAPTNVRPPTAAEKVLENFIFGGNAQPANATTPSVQKEKPRGRSSVPTKKKVTSAWHDSDDSDASGNEDGPEDSAEQSEDPTGVLDFVIDTNPSVPFANSSEDEAEQSDSAVSQLESSDTDNVNSLSEASEFRNGSSSDKAAWVDEDEAAHKVKIGAMKVMNDLRETLDEGKITAEQMQHRLREKHEKVYPVPEWARNYESEDEATPAMMEVEDTDDTEVQAVKRDVDRFFRKAQKLTTAVRDRPLNPQVDKLLPLSQRIMPPASVTWKSSTFHPTVPMLMIMTSHNRIFLYDVGTEINDTPGQAIHLENGDIQAAEFTPSGNEIIVLGERNVFFTVDLLTSEIIRTDLHLASGVTLQPHIAIAPDSERFILTSTDGSLYMVSIVGKTVLYRFKISTAPISVEWSSNGEYLITLERNNRGSVWHIPSRRCINYFNDVSFISPTVAKLSPDNNYYAVGSESGLVNIYETESLFKTTQPKPIHTMENLVTPISCLAFHHSSKLLLVTSASARRATRLLYLPKMHVMAQWPTQDEKRKYSYGEFCSSNNMFLLFQNKAVRFVRLPVNI
ncbi:hypothetical protein IWQ62_001263 [Dispira parvispora]|uniref:Uncharacterized protein n=1 Tax=Dispira parvispora TaxID=1520584 RepID=A0A9W8AZF6_9FUNG|nr:hypothetical protein IWQ62_001263 [Dispira parvispora]